MHEVGVTKKFYDEIKIGDKLKKDLGDSRPTKFKFYERIFSLGFFSREESLCYFRSYFIYIGSNINSFYCWYTDSWYRFYNICHWGNDAYGQRISEDKRAIEELKKAFSKIKIFIKTIVHPSSKNPKGKEKFLFYVIILQRSI